MVCSWFRASHCCSCRVNFASNPSISCLASCGDLCAHLPTSRFSWLQVEHVLSGRIVAELAVVKQGLMDVLKVSSCAPS